MAHIELPAGNPNLHPVKSQPFRGLPVPILDRCLGPLDLCFRRHLGKCQVISSTPAESSSRGRRENIYSIDPDWVLSLAAKGICGSVRLFTTFCSGAPAASLYQRCFRWDQDKCSTTLFCLKVSEGRQQVSHIRPVEEREVNCRQLTELEGSSVPTCTSGMSVSLLPQLQSYSHEDLPSSSG